MKLTRNKITKEIFDKTGILVEIYGDGRGPSFFTMVLCESVFRKTISQHCKECDAPHVITKLSDLSLQEYISMAKQLAFAERTA